MLPAKGKDLVTFRRSAWCCGVHSESGLSLQNIWKGLSLWNIWEKGWKLVAYLFLKIHFLRFELAIIFFDYFSLLKHYANFFSYKMVCKIFWKQMVRDPTLHFTWRMLKQTLPSHIVLGIVSMLTQQEDCHQLSHQDHFLQLLCGPWGIQLQGSTDLVWPQRVLGAQHKRISMWATLWGAPSFMLSYMVPLQWVKGYEEKEAQ